MELHVRPLVTVPLVPSLNVPVAVNGAVRPFGSAEAGAPAMVSAVNTGAPTVTVPDAETPSRVALTVTVAPTVAVLLTLTLPDASTVTDGSDDPHATELAGTDEPSLSAPVSVNAAVVPRATVRSLRDSVSTTAGWPAHASSMPTDCEPWPGKT